MPIYLTISRPSSYTERVETMAGRTLPPCQRARNPNHPIRQRLAPEAVQFSVEAGIARKGREPPKIDL